MHICDCVLHADSIQKFLLPLLKEPKKRVVGEQCYFIKSVGGIQEHLDTHPPLLSLVFALGLGTLGYLGCPLLLLFPPNTQGADLAGAGMGCERGPLP